MKLSNVAAVDIDGARYCLDCAPDVMSGSPAVQDAASVTETIAAVEREGIGGPVFVGSLDGIEHCDNCSKLLGDE